MCAYFLPMLLVGVWKYSWCKQKSLPPKVPLCDEPGWDMKANSYTEPEEYQDFEAHFEPTGQSELNCEKRFEKTFPIEHDCSQRVHIKRRGA